MPTDPLQIALVVAVIVAVVLALNYVRPLFK